MHINDITFPSYLLESNSYPKPDESISTRRSIDVLDTNLWASFSIGFGEIKTIPELISSRLNSSCKFLMTPSDTFSSILFEDLGSVPRTFWNDSVNAFVYSNSLDLQLPKKRLSTEIIKTFSSNLLVRDIYLSTDEEQVYVDLILKTDNYTNSDLDKLLDSEYGIRTGFDSEFFEFAYLNKNSQYKRVNSVLIYHTNDN